MIFFSKDSANRVKYKVKTSFSTFNSEAKRKSICLFDIKMIALWCFFCLVNRMILLK